MSEINNTIVFGGGCFWGVEKFFKKEFPNIVTKVGYIGGSYMNPVYKDVCTFDQNRSVGTNHAEVVQIKHNDMEVPVPRLVEYFIDLHDPTTHNRQGNDVGSQYRSCIFATNNYLNKIQDQISKFQLSSKSGKTIVTTVQDLDEFKFYEAEEYHQNYLEKNPGGYCNHKPKRSQYKGL